MPEVVFEINGRKYPLPASAYTSQVCVSGLGVGWVRGAPGSPGPSALLESRPSWWQAEGPDGECRTCGCCSLMLRETGQVGRTEAWVWGAGGVMAIDPPWEPLSTALAPQPRGPVCLGCSEVTWVLWGPRFLVIGFALTLSTPN